MDDSVTVSLVSKNNYKVNGQYNKYFEEENIDLDELNQRLKQMGIIDPMKQDFIDRMEILVEKLQVSGKFTEEEIMKVIKRLEELYAQDKIIVK